MSSSDNHLVVKNTIFLYCRLFVTMAIGMWTSRIVLNALGFTDQGLYNAVGGFVGLSALLTSSISNSISRFITYELGRRDIEKINKAVQNSVTVQWTLSVLIVILAETVGLWFLNNKMTIPADRLFAVNIVYQLSIGNVVISLVSSTQIALVIAYERMKIYAWAAIINSLALLFVGFAIQYYGADRLILYAVLQFLVAVGIRILYTVYVRQSFKDIHFRFGYDKEVFAPIFAFAGWNGIGTTAGILRNSGTSVLLNIFGGPIANTINGIANSVNGIVNVFANDFTTAFNPQITKQYAAGEYESLNVFLHRCSKFSYCLLLVMSVPIILNIEPLLVLWLKKIPDGTVLFVRLIIVFSLIESISRPLITAKNATGDIRNYQLIVGGILLMTLPLAYLFLKLGLPLYYSYIAFIITSLIALLTRMIMIRGSIPCWSVRDFIFRSMSRCAAATLICFSIPLFIKSFMPQQTISILVQCLVGFVWSCACVYTVALDKTERQSVKSMIRKATLKIKG